MIKRPDQRVGVFIDTQNMYHSAKHIYNARVNFGSLLDAAVDNRPVVRAIAYVAKSKTGEEQAFFDALIQSGIELKIKDVQEFSSGEKKADWDVGMTVDAIGLSERVDVVVLVTGDGDFCPLVEYLKTHGVLCEVVAFGESTNARLREIADSFLDLSATPANFLIRSRAPRGQKAEVEAGEDDLSGLMQEHAPAPRSRKNTRSSKPPEDPALPSRKIRITY
ncbi:NYN domain-containing protein [Patescibacteria group bacterium]|nr:NYN domain-containing protein [Patescibacteria group bacterium]